MAVSTVGSNVITAASPEDLTIDASTQKTVQFWAGFDGANLDLTATAIATVALTQHAKVIDGSGSGVSTGCASLDSPATGTQEATWTWDDAPDEGPSMIYAHLTSGGASIQLVASGAEADASVTITSATGDYVLGMLQSFGASVNTTGYTVVAGPATVNGETFVLVTKTTGDPSTTFTMDAGDPFPSIVCASFREVAGGGGGAVTPQGGLSFIGGLGTGGFRKPRNDNGRWIRGRGGLWVPRRRAA